MNEQKKPGKFVTSILIGGALGSLAAWALSSKKRREMVSEKISQYYQSTISKETPTPPKKRRWWLFLVAFLLLIGVALLATKVKAQDKGTLLQREKKVQLLFNADNPEGNIDLKKIVEQELVKPEDCDQTLTICQIQEVSLDLVIKKTWKKYSLPKLSNQEFAVTVPLIKNDLENLSKPEIVILQETLARRGLLTDRTETVVKDRGFFGSSTWLGVLRLAHIKKLDPKNPKFNKQIIDKTNELIGRMSKDPSYVENNPLPQEKDREPQKGDKAYSIWEKHSYLQDLSQNASKVDPGSISIEGNTDVKIEGFVNVERVSK